MQTVQQVSTLRTDAWIQIGVDRERADAEALPVGAILPCRTVATRESRETVKALRKRFGSVVTKATIRENALVAEAPRCHQPITAYGPDGAADYRALAGELFRRRRALNPHYKIFERPVGLKSPKDH